MSLRRKFVQFGRSPMVFVRDVPSCGSVVGSLSPARGGPLSSGSAIFAGMALAGRLDSSG